MSKQRISHTPEGGVCSKMMIIDSEDNIIRNVQIIGGCQGNTQGLSRLLVGMDIQEAIRRLEGINCRERGTSCPDQLAQALKKIQTDFNL
ncbi:TIGR03905 family TSCPD domain-containing protein [Parabacteroides sp. AM08-6]|uniref:TIGR03905 family TSCPD domain-containing protein n=1 Tax=Parabacteroides sp. AM08-6 TaxID=2292053 RepID=UPI000F007221|nr:TIGR03905 family TSCPD domain-containing protein [Parabacteroides sp. AM08-6]RHJ87940.1 TIGR03905 family TSCPD domain-containing protein [Parabacteroides sp. AM08-6]